MLTCWSVRFELVWRTGCGCVPAADPWCRSTICGPVAGFEGNVTACWFPCMAALPCARCICDGFPACWWPPFPGWFWAFCCSWWGGGGAPICWPWVKTIDCGGMLVGWLLLAWWWTGLGDGWTPDPGFAACVCIGGVEWLTIPCGVTMVGCWPPVGVWWPGNDDAPVNKGNAIRVNGCQSYWRSIQGSK